MTSQGVRVRWVPLDLAAVGWPAARVATVDGLSLADVMANCARVAGAADPDEATSWAPNDPRGGVESMRAHGFMIEVES